MIIYYNDTFDGATFIDECTVGLRNATSKNWSSLIGRKRENIEKHKHNIKLHLRGGISCHGLIPLTIFYRYYVKYRFQKNLHVDLLPNLRKYPLGHRLIMDNDPKHVSHSTRIYMLIKGV